MIQILNSQESNALDSFSLEAKNITHKQLIDNAGRAVAHHIIENTDDPFNKKFLFIAGFGKNGLDAIVANYYMHYYALDSFLFVIDTDSIDPEFSPYLNNINQLTSISTKDISQFNLVIDGIFGNGLNRDIKKEILKIIRKINKKKNIISIDLPTGIIADTGKSVNVSIQARETISFGLPKCGHYLSDGYEKTGDLSIYQIGQSDKKLPSKKYLIEREDVTKLFKDESLLANKYTRGKVLLYAGSENYTGAAILTAKSALCSGVGILKIMYNEKYYNVMTLLHESIDLPIGCTGSELSCRNYQQIEQHLNFPDCFIVGPGLSTSKDSLLLTKKILKEYNGKCIIDAGGLASINDYRSNKFNSIPDKSILTPHYGELSKILNIDVDEIRDNTVEILAELSQFLEGRILVLKGPNIIIVNGEAELFFVNNGKKKLATSGTGDVLSGIISSYVAKGYSLVDSAIVGAYHHAECSNYIEKSDILASNLFDVIADVKSDLTVS